MSYVNAPPSVIAANRRVKIRESLLELLINEKKSHITVTCGIKALDIIMQMPEFSKFWDDMILNIADCYIHIKKDFEVDSPWDVVYNGKVIFG